MRTTAALLLATIPSATAVDPSTIVEVEVGPGRCLDANGENYVYWKTSTGGHDKESCESLLWSTRVAGFTSVRGVVYYIGPAHDPTHSSGQRCFLAVDKNGPYDFTTNPPGTTPCPNQGGGNAYPCNVPVDHGSQPGTNQNHALGSGEVVSADGASQYICFGFQASAPPTPPPQPPTEYPTGPAPTAYPTGSAPTDYPEGSAPTEYPTGSAPTRYPTEVAPTSYPTEACGAHVSTKRDCCPGASCHGQDLCTNKGCCWEPVDPNPNNEPWCYHRTGPAPTDYPTGPAPTGYPTEVTPTRYPTEVTPTRYPTEVAPTRYPTEAVPTKYPTGAAPTDYPTITPAPTNTAYPSVSLPVQIGFDEGLDHSYSAHEIVFKDVFHSTNQKPVIIAGVPTFFGSDFFTVRVKDVTTSGFKMFGQESSCNNGHHPGKERVPWLAVVPGRHHHPDGTIIEAGTLLSKHNHVQTVQFSAPIQGAVILATIQTRNGGQPVFLRVPSKDENGFTIRMQEDEGLDQWHYEETIGWVAISAGTSSFAGQPFTAGNTEMPIINPNIEGQKWHQLGSRTLNDEDCAFGTFSFNGNNGAIFRQHHGKFTIQEDNCKDQETWHMAEQVSVMVIPGCYETALPQDVNHNAAAASSWSLAAGRDAAGNESNGMNLAVLIPSTVGACLAGMLAAGLFMARRRKGGSVPDEEADQTISKGRQSSTEPKAPYQNVSSNDQSAQFERQTTGRRMGDLKTSPSNRQLMAAGKKGTVDV